MYEHVKTGCKHIHPSEQPLQFQSGYYLNKPRTGFWWGNLRERDHLGDPDVDGRIILRRIFRK